MKTKTKWLAFNIRMPDELIPIYDFLQNELNYILSNAECRKKLEILNLSKHKGNVWRDLRDLLYGRISKWELHNKTWHSYILFENIRREMQSKHEAVIVHEELILNNMQINETLFDNLTKRKVYATRGFVSNIKRMNARPQLPTSAIFQLDYTISEKQFFRMDVNNVCKIKVNKTDWIDYCIVLPSSLNHNLTGKIAKPRFMKRKSDNQYIGICSYEYIPEETYGDKVLGVDIGQIKLFSAVALNKHGEYGQEFIHSKQLEIKNQKLKNLYNEKSNLIEIIKRNEILNVNTMKNDNRKKHLIGISNKIMNLKKQIAKEVANEVIHVAKVEGCNKIHIENLTWMSSKGGKWNHSEMHNAIINRGERSGITVVKVNPAYSSNTHPVTGEQGEKQQRIVTFANGQKVDRDILAAINLASRVKRGQGIKVKKLKKKHKAPLRVKCESRKKEIKEKLNKIKGDTKIVVFSPHAPDSGVWSRIERVQFNSSLLMKFPKITSICYNY